MGTPGLNVYIYKIVYPNNKSITSILLFIGFFQPYSTRRYCEQYNESALKLKAQRLTTCWIQCLLYIFLEQSSYFILFYMECGALQVLSKTFFIFNFLLSKFMILFSYTFHSYLLRAFFGRYRQYITYSRRQCILYTKESIINNNILSDNTHNSSSMHLSKQYIFRKILNQK